MAKLGAVVPGQRICDPVCGTGQLLLEAAGSEAPNADTPTLDLCGQDIDPDLVEVARSRLAGAGVQATLACGNSLLATVPPGQAVPWPTYDVVLAHPPFSQASWGQEHWRSGWRAENRALLPPASNADYAYILRALTLLAEGGTAVLLLPAGVLYRGGPEARIRQWLVERGLLRALIALPSGIHPGSEVPTVVLVLRRGSPARAPGDLHVVDGRGLATRVGGHLVLAEEAVALLAEVALCRAERPGLSRLVPLEELARQSFDLSLERHLSWAGSVHWAARGAPRRRVGADEGLQPAEAETRRLEEHLRARVAQLLEGPLQALLRGELTGSDPQVWRFLALHECVAKGTPRSGAYLQRDENSGFSLMQIGQTGFTPHGALDLRTAWPRACKQQRPRMTLEEGDILIRRVHASERLVGDAAIVQTRPRDATLWESSLILLRPQPARVPAHILLAWLRHPTVRAVLARSVHRSIQSSITHKDLGELPCPVFPETLSRAIEGELSAITASLHQRWLERRGQAV